MEEKLKQRSTSCIKVVFFGPESTGKTTLAKALATVFKTKWVPEFAREYLEEKRLQRGKVCAVEDIYPIAEGQMKLENEAVQQANTFLFCIQTFFLQKYTQKLILMVGVIHVF